MATGVQNNPEKLGEYIEQLKKLHTEWVDKVYTPADLGENSGYMVQEMCNLETQYQNIQKAFVNLLDKTTQYMTNRKASMDDVESTATDSIEIGIMANTNASKPSGKQGNRPNGSGTVHRTAMVK